METTSFKVPLNQNPRNSTTVVNGCQIISNDDRSELLPQSLNSLAKKCNEQTKKQIEEGIHEEIYSDEISSDEVIESGEVPFKAASRSNYSSSVTKVLRKWFEKHIDNPYPSEEDRIQICEETGLTRKQLRVWFINSRKRKLNKLVKRKTSEKHCCEKVKRQPKITNEVISEASFTQSVEPECTSQISIDYSPKIPVMSLLLKYHMALDRESSMKMSYFTTQLQKYCFCDVIEFGVAKLQLQ